MFPKNIELYLLISIIGYNLLLNSIKQKFINVLVLIICSSSFYFLTKNINKTLVFSLLCYIIYKFSQNQYMEGYKNKTNKHPKPKHCQITSNSTHRQQQTEETKINITTIHVPKI